MKMSKVFVRTAGAVGITLASLAAGADDGVSAPSPHVPPVNTTDGPSLPTAARHKKAAPTAARRTLATDILDMGKLEMVTARYADGKIKLEREVGQDAAGNYVNQGTFKMYSPTGEVIKAGEFLNGKLQGKWTQQLSIDEGHLFSGSQDKEWAGPFTSEATFQDGRLNGVWTIKDCHGQNILQWCFDNGTRAGTWTWWHPNGQKRLEATYINGVLSGDVVEYSRDGKTLSQNTYIDGKCVVKAVGWYTLGQKRYEGTYLRSPNMPQATYDWWNSRLTTSASAPEGPDLQHSLWTEWYPSGNKKTEAQYDRGVAVGKITWWYENGQIQAEGEFESGKKNGTWITWHPNGLKESIVEYRTGNRVGKPMEWSSDGKMVDSHEGQEHSLPHVGQRSTATY